METGEGQSAARRDRGSDAASLPALNTAQLVHSMGQSEMRVGMHSQEFGSISISTTLSRQELAAQISIDHTGLGDALAAHLPGMQEKLGAAYGVQARVEIRDTGAQFDGGGASTAARCRSGPRDRSTGADTPAGSRRPPRNETTFGDAAGSVAATLGPDSRSGRRPRRPHGTAEHTDLTHSFQLENRMSHTGATLTPLTDTSTASMFAAMNAANTQAKANATTGSSSPSDSGSDSNSLSATNLGSTFLELLAQELQNQDPTSPVDPTQMVGQIISLNQLDQLIGINQTLTDAADGTTSAPSTGTGSGDAILGTNAGTDASGKSGSGTTDSTAAASAAAAQAYMNAAGALLAGTPAASGAQPSADTFNISNLNALSGGK